MAKEIDSSEFGFFQKLILVDLKIQLGLGAQLGLYLTLVWLDYLRNQFLNQLNIALKTLDENLFLQKFKKSLNDHLLQKLLIHSLVLNFFLDPLDQLGP